MKVDNAIIMAAGTASRFAPLSYEMPKALTEVNGEILLERQIQQLKEAGIEEIVIVVGYKKNCFNYLKDKYNVIIVENDSYLTRNNNASIFAVKSYLKNSYICSSDNYFWANPFANEEDESYYAALYSEAETKEWCLTVDKDNYITGVNIGGRKSWYMMGHAFWSETFSRKFIGILEEEYNFSETKNKLWESIYIEHISELEMKIKKYPSGSIFEFDTLDELRKFDESYKGNTRSAILKSIAKKLDVEEKDIINISAFKDMDNAAAGFIFAVGLNKYKYYYGTEKMEKILNE